MWLGLSISYYDNIKLLLRILASVLRCFIINGLITFILLHSRKKSMSLKSYDHIGKHPSIQHTKYSQYSWNHSPHMLGIVCDIFCGLKHILQGPVRTRISLHQYGEIDFQTFQLYLCTICFHLMLSIDSQRKITCNPQ